MFKIIHPGLNFFSRCVVKNSCKRYFLSEAYRCDEAWANRLKNPIFKKVNLNNLYFELDISFQKNKFISTLDIDLLFNSVEDSSYKNEIEDVLYRIRLCPECSILPERATHAALKWYLDNAATDDLFNVLSDRLHYGLFPDYHLTNLLMDKYLKEKDSKSAVKVAVLQMLQEDFDNPIMQALALNSCYNYLESPDVWLSYKAPKPDPDEEVKKLRVNYLRNPYFDDHFDLTDTNHLVGKTLWLFGRTVDGVMGASSQLVGLVLYEKYEKCAKFLEGVLRDGAKLHAEAVAKAKEYSVKRPKQEEEEEMKTAEDKTRGDAEEKVVDEWKNKTLDLLGSISEKNLVKGSLLSDSTELVRKMVQEHEGADIKHQCEVYKQWEKDREEHIKSEMERLEVLNVKSEIEKTKEELEKEEEKLFFFDREEEIHLVVKEKEKQMAEVFYYKEKRKKKIDMENYIPPDVQKRKF